MLTIPVAALMLGGCSLTQSPSETMADTLDLSGNSPAELAAAAFDVSDADKRRQSVMLIANGPHGHRTPYVRLYRKLLTDPDPTVQAACARALGMHGKVKDAVKLADLFDTGNTFVRWEAAKALQRIHNPAVADELIDVVQNDDDADVRIAAAKALGQYAEPAVFDALVGALQDQNYGVVQQARDSLRTLTGHQGPANPSHWLSWAEQHRGNLFADRRKYTYQPYDPPPSWVERAWFWQNQHTPEPRTPLGYDVAEAEANAS